MIVAVRVELTTLERARVNDPGRNPSIVVIGGPNGAGKTTISRAVIAETLGIAEFVNADVIAQGLSGFDPERAALSAGRIMLARLKDLAASRADFAFETTLASRTFAPWIKELVASGYEFNLAFVWLRSPDLAVRRVAARIRKGGHSVPPDTIHRRYRRGVANVVHLYLPLATRWRVYDNSGRARPVVIAYRDAGAPEVIRAPQSWLRILEIARDQANQDDR
jgi:predicted ABC-type ATPase